VLLLGAQLADLPRVVRALGFGVPGGRFSHRALGVGVRGAGVAAAGGEGQGEEASEHSSHGRRG
jgi:hypothetical protein